MGRAAYLISEAKFFDRFCAKPPSRPGSLAEGVFVAGANVGTYELLALAIYALIKPKNGKSGFDENSEKHLQ
jgi:hypothetical protein